MTTGRSDGINQPVFSAKEKTQRFEGNPLTFAAARRIVSQKRFWTASLSYVATVMFLVCSLASVSSPPLSNARLCRRRQVNYPTLLCYAQSYDVPYYFLFCFCGLVFPRVFCSEFRGRAGLGPTDGKLSVRPPKFMLNINPGEAVTCSIIYGMVVLHQSSCVGPARPAPLPPHSH